MADRVAALAAKLIDARRTGRRLAIPTGPDAPASLTEAYKVQAAVTAGLGETSGGYKVGLAPDGSGVFAPIHRSQIVRGGASYTARPFDRVGIELELGFRFARQVPGSASPWAVLECIDAVLVAIELCETRYTTNEGVEKHTALADHQFNRGLALGSECRLDRAIDFEGIASRWIIDGRVSHERKASHPNGDPLAPLAILPRLLAEQGRALEPGHIVITGSLNGITWAPVGAKVEGIIDGLGRAAVTIAP
jgi:2-keto-4-pentenoate hydratase